MTSVPACQYRLGRQCASVSLIQCHEPRCAGDACDRHVLLDRGLVGDRDVEGDDDRHAHADRLALQRGDEAKVCWSSVRSWVWKREVRVTCLPSLRSATALTV